MIAVAGLVGWLVGPAVVELLYGQDARPIALVAACAAAGVIAASITQILSQALVAGGSTGELAGAWVGGLVVGLGTMALLERASRRASGGRLPRRRRLFALALATWRILRPR